ncbi:MAG: ATP-binding protein [Pseudomonadota bacterium]
MDTVRVDKALKRLNESLANIPHELNDLDWKIDISSKGDKLAQHISAYSNYPDGGFLIFGIKSDGNIQTLEKNQVEEIIRKIGNIARDGVEPKVAIEHKVMPFRESYILIISIPETIAKPVHIKGKGIEFSYIRSGASTRQMSRQELAQCLLNSPPPRYEEQDACLLGSLSEITAKLECESFFELLGLPFPSTEAAIAAELIKHKLIKRIKDQYTITNLGVLIAAKDMSTFDGHQRRGIRVIFYKTSNKLEKTDEVLGKRGYAIGFRQMIDYIAKRLPRHEEIKGALRQDVSLFPIIVLREIVANAIIHQDLMIHDVNPRIEIFTDRIEVTNPGILLSSITVDRIIDTDRPRNELLARIMHKLNICEDRGSGIDRALQEVEYYGLPPLKFEESEASFKVIIYAPRAYKDMSPDERIRACYQHCVLRHISNGKMTNASLRERFKISPTNYPMVSKVIKESLEANKIKIGNPDMESTKYIYYIPYWAK